MGATFPRVKVWAADEDILTSDLNAEFDNILNNLSPAGMDDYSTNTSQMQIQTSPGGVGTESLATSLAGEIARLRYVLARALGKTYWYESPSITLEETNSTLNQIAGLDPNRIVSGAVQNSSTDETPAFLVPNGAANSIRVEGTPTNLVFRVNGSLYTLSTDLTVTGLVQAPSTNNTALVNDATLVGDLFSKIRGEFGTTLTIDTVGTEISALVGKYAGFKIFNGADTEYFTAYVKSATELTSLRRGFFFDSTLTAIPRITISDNNVITLMKLTYLFLKTDLTVEAVYTNPTYSATQPTSPAVGDYWQSFPTKVWYRFNGSSWVQADATLIGICLTSSTNTIAARPGDFYATYSATNDLEISHTTNTQVVSSEQGTSINVAGKLFNFAHDDLIWDITSDLESGFSENSSTMYFLYVTEKGAKKMSPQYPQFRQEFQRTYYHPYRMWRCVGLAYNNGSSNLSGASSLNRLDNSYIRLVGDNGFGATNTKIKIFLTETESKGAGIIRESSDGDNFTIYWPSFCTMTFCDADNGDNVHFGFSKNPSASDKTTSVQSATASRVLIYSESPAGRLGSVSFSGAFKPGDVVWAHTDGLSDNSNGQAQFYIAMERAL